MRVAGLLLLLAGWGIVLTAIVLLSSVSERASFVLAGVAIEILGFGLFIRSQWMAQRERG
jgi:hypothetical protein